MKGSKNVTDGQLFDEKKQKLYEGLTPEQMLAVEHTLRSHSNSGFRLLQKVADVLNAPVRHKRFGLLRIPKGDFRYRGIDKP